MFELRASGGSGPDGAAAEGQEEELRKLRLVELRDRCLAAGVDEDAMDVAMEADVPKHAMARLLGLSTETIRRMVARGDLPGKKVAGRLRFDPREIQAWLDEQAA